MTLRSRTFSGEPALEAALVRDNAHIVRGARGEHVARIQAVVMFLDGSTIDPAEIKAKLYGPSTARAVQDYKRARNIVNHSYQNSADDIVGKMTIKALDDELMTRQVDHGPAGKHGHCNVLSPIVPLPTDRFA